MGSEGAQGVNGGANGGFGGAATYATMMPTYAEWYRAAMASGEVVPASGMPLPVPVVVPVNLIAPNGTSEDEGYAEAEAYGAASAAAAAPGGMAMPMPVPMPMMVEAYPGGPMVMAPMMAHGAYGPDFVAAQAQAEYFATMQLQAQQYYGYPPSYVGSMEYARGPRYGGRGGRGAGVSGRGPRDGNQWRNAFDRNGQGGGRFHYNRHAVADGRGGAHSGSNRASQNTVFVKDIPASVSERELAETFAASGSILDVRMCRDANSNKFSYAFVAFEYPDDVERALLMDKTTMHGKHIIVRRSDTAVIPVNPLLLPQNEEEIESTARTIYVANVDKSVDSNELKTFFEKHAGAVNRLHLQVKNNAAANVAFVEFVELDAAASALQLTGKQLSQRVLRVSASKTPLRVHRRATNGQPESANDADDAEAREDDAETATAAPPPPPSRKVYVSNLPKNVSPGSLRVMFSEFGRVANIELLNNPKSRFPYAFVEFDDAESARRALDLRGREINGCALRVELTNNKKRRGGSNTRVLDAESLQRADRTVYVTDIDPDMDPTFVRSKFEDECGPISLFWYKAFTKGEKQAIAYIEFVELSSVDKALDQCRTHFLGDSRLIKVRHSDTALRRKEGDADACYTPESSIASSGDDRSEEDGDSVVRDLSAPIEEAEAADEADDIASKLGERVEKLMVNNVPAA